MRSHVWRPGTLILVAGLTLLACGGEETPVLKTVTTEELKAIVDTQPDALVIDVRRPEEYVSYHVPAVKQLIVHTEIDQSLDLFPADRDTAIYLICRTGRRSGVAGHALIEAGYTNVYNVVGGTNDWRDRGFPIDSGPGITAAPGP